MVKIKIRLININKFELDEETEFNIGSELFTELKKQISFFHERGIEVEFTAYIAKSRARIYELPIRYYPRTQLQGKKINWKDGVAALFHLVKFNFFVEKEKAFTNLPEAYGDNYHTKFLKSSH